MYYVAHRTATLFSTITIVLMDYYTFHTFGNGNEMNTLQLQIIYLLDGLMMSTVLTLHFTKVPFIELLVKIKYVGY